MRRAEMRRAARDLLMAAALLAAPTGCAQHPPSALAAPTSPASGETRGRPLKPVAPPVALAAQPAASVPGGGAAPDVQIELFECFKAGEGPDDLDGGSRGIPIGAWQGGGPGGASWNVSDLSCAAIISSTCREGEVASELRIGRALVARQSSPLGGSGRTEWRFQVKRAQWTKNLDEVGATKGGLYRTAIFRLTSTLTCRNPFELGPGPGPRGEFTADRVFLAGFAAGE